jgi:hypothetical protein
MFDSLNDKMKQDDAVEIPRKERIVRWVAIAVLSVVAFGGLYFAVQMIP